MVIAGPNGSGKSSLTASFESNPKFRKYIYINPDDIAKTFFSHIDDTTERYRAAMRFCEDKRQKAIEKGEPLAFETVFSTSEKLDYLYTAKKKGYYISTIYVTTKSPEINIKRVKKRVLAGGHYVEPEKVRSRYYRSMNYLADLFKASDSMLIYDSSEPDKPPTPLLHKSRSICALLVDKSKYPWIFDQLDKGLGSDKFMEYLWVPYRGDRAREYIQVAELDVLGYIPII